MVLLNSIYENLFIALFPVLVSLLFAGLSAPGRNEFISETVEVILIVLGVVVAIVFLGLVLILFGLPEMIIAICTIWILSKIVVGIIEYIRNSI